MTAAVGAHTVAIAESPAAGMWTAASQVHWFHAAALLAVAALARGSRGSGVSIGGWILAIGTLLFSGSLYSRAAGLGWMPGWLAPLGGMTLCAGWVWLAIALFKSRPEKEAGSP